MEDSVLAVAIAVVSLIVSLCKPMLANLMARNKSNKYLWIAEKG